MPLTKKTLFHYLTLYALPIILTLICTVIFSTGLNEFLEYKRPEVYKGSSWLLLTCNFTHLSWAHLAANMAAVFIIWSLFWEDISPVLAIRVILFLCVCVGAGVHFLSKDVIIYTGFSGAAHGLIIAGALITLKKENFVFNAIVIAGTLIKHIHEHLSDDKSSPLFDNGYVVTDSHQYGIIGAAIIGSLILYRQYRKNIH